MLDIQASDSGYNAGNESHENGDRRPTDDQLPEMAWHEATFMVAYYHGIELGFSDDYLYSFADYCQQLWADRESVCDTLTISEEIDDYAKAWGESFLVGYDEAAAG